MEFERRSFAGRKKKRSALPRILGALVLVGLLAWFWYARSLGPVDAGSQARVTLTVPTGAGLSAVAADLEEKDLIKSPFAFKTHARVNGQDRLIRAGTYVLQPSMTATEILAVLTGGETGEVSITIPEGYTIEEIDALMAEKGFTKPDMIRLCSLTCSFSEFPFLPGASGYGGQVEGYAFPDTYFIGGEGSDPHAFLSRLLQTFESKVIDGMASEIEESGRSLQDIMTMASLIEKEAANDSERPIISGILWKRLDEGIILGVDAAVRYAVNKEPGEPLTRQDLQSDSPYNIRLKAGLPHGPIANPGLKSIEAALHPEESPYYYYLHGTDGNIRYAVTNDEHNANKARYLR
jgi:UPF0755 protein